MKTALGIVGVLAAVVLVLNLNTISEGLDETLEPVATALQHALCKGGLWILAIVLLLISIVLIVIGLFGGRYNSRYGGGHDVPP